MDSARADALAARGRLLAQGWIARRAEGFRHLPPPPAALWLGEGVEPQRAGCEAAPLAGAGWTLHPIVQTPRGSVDARWLDATDPAPRAELFDGLPPPGDDGDEAAPFAWAHRALVRQGLRLRIGAAPDGSDGAVWLHLRRQPRAVVEAPLLVIELLPGARCVLVESHGRGMLGREMHGRDASAQARSGNGPHGCTRAVVQNLQVHVRLAERSALQHLRAVLPGADDCVAHHVHARLARGAHYDQCLLASGSRYHLQRTLLDLHGDGASARCAAALLADGATLDRQVRARHAAARTRSAVDALALARNAASAVVNAHTHIAPGCDDAQARQRLAGIPTGGQPRLVLRPHLEIEHDQVQAAHGATWGAVPQDALFLARQRGLDERSAQAMIVEGLARAVLARALDDAGLLETLGLDALLRDAVAAHLSGARRDVRKNEASADTAAQAGARDGAPDGDPRRAAAREETAHG
jgi:Fe-S cluster assembly protein SufD